MTVIEAINDTAKALTNLSRVLVAVGEQTKGVPAQAAVSIPVDKAPKKAEATGEKNSSETSTEATKNPVTIEQVRAVMVEKSQAGLTAQVKALLETFGASKLSAVNPDDYEALLEAAKEIK